MSWKATAFVNDIIGGITRSEKLVLFTLADFHHTINKAAWPNRETLAENCLLSVRHLQRVLDALERKGFIRTRSGKGRGNYSCYEIAGLDFDKEDKMSAFNLPEKGTQKETFGAVKEDKSERVIRKEQVEPVLEPVHARCIDPTAQEIYKLYPRKAAPRDAQKAIISALKRLPQELKNQSENPLSHVDWLKERTRLFAESNAGQAGDFVPYPATWFNGSRYLEDERDWGKTRKEQDLGKGKSTGAVHNTHENSQRYAEGADFIIE